MNGLQNYRVTPENLPGLDQKTRDGLTPLLEALNDKLGRVITALNALPVPLVKETSFISESSGSAYVDLGLGRVPTELWVSALTQEGGPINFVYSWSWTPLPTGARVYFVGLAVSATYGIRVRWL